LMPAAMSSKVSVPQSELAGNEANRAPQDTAEPRSNEPHVSSLDHTPIALVHRGITAGV
jgi:hypothetical protein